MIVEAALTIFLAGNAKDVRPTVHGPVLDLPGSSAEPAGLQAMIDAVRGCTSCSVTLDVVVIRASGDQSLNDVFMKLNGVDSSQTFVITDRDPASRDDFVTAVHNAEIVWFAGGDQCNYIRWIKGTPLQRQVEHVFKRGGGVGGNSAGLAIQGDIAYDACPDVSATSKECSPIRFTATSACHRNFFAGRR